jgi:hypothetical protein
MNDLTIVHISGYGRSGSTLLEELLSKKLGAVSVGELKYLWQRGLVRNELCSCGSPTRSCGFWNEVIFESFPGGCDYEEIESLRKSVERHTVLLKNIFLKFSSKKYHKNREEYIQILLKVFRAIAKVSGSRVIIDSSKDPAHLELLMDIFPSIKVIHMIRNPNAVIYSFSKPKVRHEVYWKTELMGTRTTLRAICDWNFITKSVEHLTNGLNVYTLRYEDLCHDPSKNIDACIKELKLSTSTVNQVNHSVSGNPSRFESSKSRVVKIDERWKNDTGIFKKCCVSLLTYPVRKKYGY